MSRPTATRSVLDEAMKVTTVVEHSLEDVAARAHGLAGAVRLSVQGGKYLRPLLVKGVHEALGGDRHDDADDVAAAMELFHGALTVHDDVLDGDHVRRGRPNAIGVAREHAGRTGVTSELVDLLGLTEGLLAGDVLLGSAMLRFGRLRAPWRVRDALSRLMEETLASVAEGERLDIHHAVHRNTDARAALEMLDRKTASYTFRAPMLAGAILADASGEQIRILDEIATNLGIAYQLQDDLLGVFGDGSETGKSNLGDLREGKRTLLVLLAEHSESWARVERHFGRPDLDEPTAQLLRQALIDSGALSGVRTEIALRTGRVSDRLTGPELPADLRRFLGEVITLLEGRRR